MTLADVIAHLIGFINMLIPVLVALELVFFMWTALRYVYKGGEGGGEARGQLGWALISIFVTLSIWGILNVLCYTFLTHSCG